MSSKKILDDFSEKFSTFLESSPVKDLEKNAKAFMGTAFEKMDLVTKEEFDIHQRILENACHKIMSLEERVKQLEEQLAEKNL